MRLCAQSYNFVLYDKLNCLQKGDHKDAEINDENKIKSTNFKNFKKRALLLLTCCGHVDRHTGLYQLAFLVRVGKSADDYLHKESEL